jgi:Domain of unknown function (DUF5664)
MSGLNTTDKPEEAKRNKIGLRFDIIDPNFLKALAQIGYYGADKYGDLNWQKSRLDGEKGPINHIYDHLHKYRTREPYDHEVIGTKRKYHLAAIAFNAMMEFWYEEQAECNYREKEIAMLFDLPGESSQINFNSKMVSVPLEGTNYCKCGRTLSAEKICPGCTRNAAICTCYNIDAESF